MTRFAGLFGYLGLDVIRPMIVPISKIKLRKDEDGVWIAKSALLPGCHAHGCDRGEAIPPAFRERFVLVA